MLSFRIHAIIKRLHIQRFWALKQHVCLGQFWLTRGAPMATIARNTPDGELIAAVSGEGPAVWIQNLDMSPPAESGVTQPGLLPATPYKMSAIGIAPNTALESTCPRECAAASSIEAHSVVAVRCAHEQKRLRCCILESRGAELINVCDVSFQLVFHVLSSQCIRLR